MENVIIFVIIVTVFLYLFKKFQKNKKIYKNIPDEFVVFAVNTTGLDVNKDDIIEIGAIRIKKNKKHHQSFQCFVKTDKKIPAKITRINGITNDVLNNEGIELEEALNKFINFIGNTRLITYNADFHMGFIDEAVERLGLPIIQNRVTCVLEMARRLLDLNSYKLENIAKKYSIELPTTRTALPTCKAVAKLFSALSVLGGK